MAPGAAGPCAALEAEIFAGDDPWPESAFASELANPANLYLGLVEPGAGGPGSGDRVLAYGGLTRLGPPDHPEYEIHTIAVDPVLRGRGLGRRLLEQLLAAADAAPGPVFLEVRTDNEPAIALYRSHGFDTVGIRKRYYRQSGADAYTMARPAPGTS
ncbi:ribosomal protein S18-alanine N-acetyltransferase [uncultured Corynebacterium sp.]|uniref:ribosomal protein S18-alanine N-acetyltransferase n=1 Tax=uncultured Corynebacterium sp. TaxID=159447 RepID=UPI0025D8D11F|nr:ribosomal protein S18-alanine N-acetyltransferase [uncultured Corynebacterium sp.]